MKKTCNKCKQEKSFDDFHVDMIKRDGRRTICKVCASQNRVSYRIRFPEKRRIADRVWQSANRERDNMNHKRRYSSSIVIRLKKNLRNRLVVAIKSAYKDTSAVEDLGCSIEDFKLHIEKQFLPGMTWGNWSRYGWHIDHIVPLSFATSEDELKQLVKFTNMRPMWAIDNLKKGSKYE